LISTPLYCPYFVGRQPELAFLVDRRRDLAKARGGIVLVGGDAGIGKSRLVREFLDVTGQSRGRVAIGRCRPFASEPYAPLVELLTTFAPASARLVPAQTQGAQLTVLADLFVSVAAKHAIVGVIEDLHWSDSGTLDALVLLAERIATTRMLLVATYRANELGPEHPHYVSFGALQRNPSVTVIGLAPLGIGEARDFIDATLRDTQHHIPLDLRRQVVRIAEGNPFFTEELLKSAVDRDGSRLSDRSLPTTVRAAIIERMRPLSAADRAILTQAAVIGRRFELGLLANILEVDSAEVLPTLQRARGLQIVAETDDPAAFRFRHALTREAIYDQLLIAARRPLHRRIALTLESQTASGPPLDVLAYHWWAAGDRVKATRYGERGGDAAAALHAYADAAECYERTLSLLEPAGRDAMRVRGKIGFCYFRAGLNDRAIDNLRPAWTFFASATDDAPWLFHLARTLAAATYNSGHRVASADFLRAAVDAIERCGDARVTERARLTLASYLSDAGEVEETRLLLRSIDERLIADDTGLTITFWQSTCRVCAQYGDVDGVRRATERVVEIGEHAADTVATIDGLREAGVSALIIGETAAARKCLTRAVEICAALKMTPNHGDALLEIALERVLSGAYLEARALVVRALPMIGDVTTARQWAVLAALAVGTALDDRDLLAHEPDAAFIDHALASEVPQLYGPLTALCVPLLAARGDQAAAQHLLRRVARTAATAKSLFGSFPLVVVAALTCEAALLDTVREVSRRSRGCGPAAEHSADLAQALLDYRFGDAGAASAPARRAATGFAAIGWPLYEALAREVEGDAAAAQRIRERIGYRGTLLLRGGAGSGHVATGGMLTGRELEVAQLVSDGGTNREIAATLHVSVKLVEKHLSSIYAKLALTSRSQLTAHMIGLNGDGQRPVRPQTRR